MLGTAGGILCQTSNMRVGGRPIMKSSTCQDHDGSVDKEGYQEGKGWINCSILDGHAFTWNLSRICSSLNYARVHIKVVGHDSSS